MILMMTENIMKPEQINEWQWQIIQTRNPAFDGALFYGVRSTGIYCKPSCASRRPKRENATFFASCAEAESAGFRACLRCRPQIQTARSATSEIIIKVCNLIEKNSGEQISLEFLATEVNISPSHLQRIFKNAIGVSLKEFADAHRLNSFKKQVRRTNVTAAMYESGFGSSRALYEKATQNLGMTPATYRKGGKNIKISYATAESSIGKLIVATTEKGICSITFGETAAELLSNLKDEFPAAEIQPDAESLEKYVQAIIKHLDGTRKTLDLPLDLQATAFQLKVWAELRRIPFGETRSYKQVAESIGNLKAVRAVARACATNPVALVNPCHRVVAADGKLSGYRWGVSRKRMLLDQEQSIEKGG